MKTAVHDFSRISLERIDTPGLDDASRLNPAELVRLDSISHARRRRQFLAGRVLVRKLLSTLEHQQNFDSSLDISAIGKPVLRHRPDLHLSISHSGDWIACAVASVAVGLDIERTDSKRSTTELIQLICSGEEQGLIDSLPGDRQHRLFIELWTVKEAWLKRQGAALDVARMRAIRWVPASAANGDSVSWFTSDGLSITLLGPPAHQSLINVPSAMREATYTTRHIEDA